MALKQGLYRQASNQRVYEFLGRDFTQREHRAAAAKNAFALMGQHK